MNEDTEEDEGVQTSENNKFSVKFFDTHKTKKKLEQPLLSFYDHLKSLNSGMLNMEGTAKPHVHQTGALIKSMNPDADNLEGFVKNYGKDVWTKWCEPAFCEGRFKSGTVISSH